MADLFRKPIGTSGKVHNITPESAGWGYVGFGLYHLKPGDKVSSTSPSLSTARHRYMRLPLIVTNISSRCHRPSGLERFRYFAGNGPDIVGISADEFWMIECKGLGAGKPSTHRNNFDRALASAVSYYEECIDEWPELKPIIGLALPDAPDFRKLLKLKARKPLRSRLNLWVLLYKPTNKSIVPFEPSAVII